VLLRLKSFQYRLNIATFLMSLHDLGTLKAGVIHQTNSNPELKIETSVCAQGAAPAGLQGAFVRRYHKAAGFTG
jgi:hypothetical protein